MRLQYPVVLLCLAQGCGGTPSWVRGGTRVDLDRNALVSVGRGTRVPEPGQREREAQTSAREELVDLVDLCVRAAQKRRKREDLAALRFVRSVVPFLLGSLYGVEREAEVTESWTDGLVTYVQLTVGFDALRARIAPGAATRVLDATLAAGCRFPSPDARENRSNTR